MMKYDDFLLLQKNCKGAFSSSRRMNEINHILLLKIHYKLLNRAELYSLFVFVEKVFCCCIIYIYK
jgi:hypothetical protein